MLKMDNGRHWEDLNEDLSIKGDTISIPDISQFKGRRVEFLIIPMQDDNQDLLDSSIAHLNMAYGNNEPEYSPDDVKERNPNYGKKCGV